MTAPPIILDPVSPSHLAAAKQLCHDYAESLGFSLCFQGFDREMAEFPYRYAAERGGALRLGLVDDRPAGVVALHDLGDGVCEMKRLYVAPPARGAGLGRQLAVAIVEAGRTLGYRVMRLDTLATMTAAATLYRSLGFRPCADYNANPLPGALFFELPL